MRPPCGGCPSQAAEPSLPAPPSLAAVISPDVFLNGGEIGVPPYFAARLSFPERVTPWNVDKLREAVIAGPGRNPGAVAVEDERGRVILLKKDRKVCGAVCGPVCGAVWVCGNVRWGGWRVGAGTGPRMRVGYEQADGAGCRRAGCRRGLRWQLQTTSDGVPADCKRSKCQRLPLVPPARRSAALTPCCPQCLCRAARRWRSSCWPVAPAAAPQARRTRRGAPAHRRSMAAAG